MQPLNQLTGRLFKRQDNYRLYASKLRLADSCRPVRRVPPRLGWGAASARTLRVRPQAKRGSFRLVMAAKPRSPAPSVIARGDAGQASAGPSTGRAQLPGPGSSASGALDLSAREADHPSGLATSPGWLVAMIQWASFTLDESE